VRTLWEFDQRGFHAIHGLREPWLDPIMQGITSTGLGWVQLVGILLAFALLWGRRRSAGRREGWLGLNPVAWSALAAGLLSGAIRLPLAVWIARERPSNFDTAMPLEQVFGHSSFPSGHTTTSFAIATVLIFALWGSRTAWAGWLALLWASLVGLSRIYVGVHFPTDVIGGAGLGATCGAATYLVMRHRFAWIWDAPRDPPSEGNMSASRPAVVGRGVKP
jgi:undecaprenyl-diphosphatase